MWDNQGPGSLTENLPDCMTMTDGCFWDGSAVSYGSGFLPAVYQGMVVRTVSTPESNLVAAGTPGQQRAMLDGLNR